MQVNVADAVSAMEGTLVRRGGEAAIARVSIDTRTVQAGDWFVAIRGAHFDGHDFVGAAVQRGAVGVIVERAAAAGVATTVPGAVAVVSVDDTQVALGALARAWRMQLAATPCVAITGSNGKSTTKEMVASIVAERGQVCKTEGNFNNLIGLPLTLFRATPNDDVLVLEMGMSARGEIAALAAMAQPDIGIITNVSAAHLDTLLTIENVAAAKAELFEQMAPGTTLIINREDPLIVQHAARMTDRRHITFGMQNDCDVQFGHMDTDASGRTALSVIVAGRTYHTQLPVPGTHNVMNAMAAIGAGLALEIAPAVMMERLAAFAPMKMRMERLQLANSIQVINDCYNANPASMRMALRTIAAAPRAGRFVAVLGDMLELGPQAEAAHEVLGRQIAEFRVDAVFVTGTYAAAVRRGALAAGFPAAHVQDGATAEALQQPVAAFVQPGDMVLVKGSRGMRMEQVIHYLQDYCGVN